MRKNRWMAWVLAVLTIASVAGCAGGKTEKTTEKAETAAVQSETAKETEKKEEATEAESQGKFEGNDLIPVVDGVAEITCGATTTGGWTYMYTSSAAQVVSSNNENINITPAITTGGGENLISVATGEMPMGVASAAYIYNYYNGNESEGIAANPQLRTLYGSPNSFLSVIVRADSDYQTIEDLKGARVSICNKGNSGQLLISELLKVMGREDYYDLQYLTPSESYEALNTSTIDSLWICACDPHSSVTEIFNMPGGARFIEFSDEQKKQFLDSCSYLSDVTRPAGTYKGQDSDYHTVGSPYALVVTEDFPEELAYQIAKTLDEKYDEWTGVFAGVKGATAQNTIDTAIAPLHPGTERYFREKGYIQ